MNKSDGFKFSYQKGDCKLFSQLNANESLKSALSHFLHSKDHEKYYGDISGSSLHKYRYQTQTGDLLSEIKRELQSEIAQRFQSIEALDLSLISDRFDPSAINVDLKYKRKGQKSWAQLTERVI